MAGISGDDFLTGKFPADFMFGTASSAFQIEGAWNEDGRGECIWDRFSHMPGNVKNGDTADIACDSYHKYEEDIKILKQLKVHFYRLSLSWSRIFPDGHAATPNPAGVAYYNKVLDGLIEAGIMPIVTIYHFDLPQALLDKGGWENDQTVLHLRDYARFCFETFGDRVKHWITINEPFIHSYMSYETGRHPPNMESQGTSMYVVGHNLLRAHGEIRAVYDRDFRAAQKGFVTVAIDGIWHEPADPSDPAHVRAAERGILFWVDWFAHPLFVSGDYPLEMKKTLKERLPSFTEEEKLKIKGRCDYFALNHYLAFMVTPLGPDDVPPNQFNADTGNVTSLNDSWPNTGRPLFKVTPWALRKLLNYIKDNYGNPDILITENGYCDPSGTLNDTGRVAYLTAYLQACLKAIVQDNVKMKGYAFWSLLDNFEWDSGYDEKFGLFQVDFTSPERTRTARNSANQYAKIIQNHGFKTEA